MSKLTLLTREDVAKTKQLLDTQLSGIGTLDAAAQAYTDVLYEQFGEQAPLIRLYCTIPCKSLPDDVRSFVLGVAKDNRVSDQLVDDTPVLTLLGTTGVEEAWCDRRQSHGHKGIPLLSSSFVDAIPMVSRLLQQMGVGIEWLDRDDLRYAQAGAANLSGFFYAPHAATEKDAQGRLVIPAQEFVRDYKIKTVFGAGAAYSGGALVVVIVFASENVTVAASRQFQPLIDAFVSSTTNLMRSGALFGE